MELTIELTLRKRDTNCNIRIIDIYFNKAIGHTTSQGSSFSNSFILQLIDEKADIEHIHHWKHISNKPALYPPSAHKHIMADITGLSLDWSAITGKPTLFPPSTHLHHWDDVTYKPATYTPAFHTHDERYYTETEIDALLETKTDLSRHETDVDGQNQYNMVVSDAILEHRENEVIHVTQAYRDEISTRINSKAPSSHAHAWGEVTGKPTSMPASDVYAWAKAATKPAYAWGEIASKPTTFTPSAHTHDERYYTETEVNTLLETKTDLSRHETDIDGQNQYNKVVSDAILEHRENEVVHVTQAYKDILSTEIAALRNDVQSLNGASVLIGTIPLPSSGVNNFALHLRAVALKESVKVGYTLKDTDNVEWWCESLHSAGNGSVWNNIGQNIIGRASNTVEGTVKGSSGENGVAVLADGTMEVNSIATNKVTGLQAYVEGTKVNSAKSADAVAWGGVTGKPTTFTPSAHTHDERYYTETEINALLETKTDLSRHETDVDGQNQYNMVVSDAILEHTHNSTILEVTTEDVVGKTATVQSNMCASSSSGGGDGYLTTYTWNNSTHATQMYIDADATYIMAIRHKTAAGWSAWKKLWTEANLNPASFAAAAHKHVMADVTGLSLNWSAITGKPTSMPASDVYAWAKAATKPAYVPVEVGADYKGRLSITADKPNYGGHLVFNQYEPSATSGMPHPAQWYNVLRMLHANAEGYWTEIATNFTGEASLSFRKMSVGGISDWCRVWHSHNFNPANYTLTTDSRLTNARPASDVYAWAKGIFKPAYWWDEIASKPTTFPPSEHTHDTVKTNYTLNGGVVSPSYVIGGTVRFNTMKQGLTDNTLGAGYLDWMLMDTYTGSDVPWVTGFGVLKGITPRAFIATGAKGSVTTGAWRVEELARTAQLTWDSISGKPTTFTPSAHTHDDRYYTETESNTLLAAKANTSGTYAGLNVGTATKLKTTNYTLEQIGTEAVLSYNGVKVFKIDSAGNLKVKGDVEFNASF